ncbi:hypothetical protein [Pseudorhodoplanes sp.]|uniref:hypothetical protein n=1 Tax=Pseudorhodoplanes sp. TaxID=1934341 RepID=UPI002CE93C8F|nr:hypothetical protein [Pseudorhodoplanes sp.]HWV52912.1 hypothetical protein [Pseudorhodoplanes sp.]
MWRIALGLLSSLLTVAGLLSLFMFYDRYWRWRDCFNELGRCFDPATADVYLDQSGPVWGSFAAIFLFLGIIVLARLLKQG